MEKPRISYADFAMGRLATVLSPSIEAAPHTVVGSVAWLIHRYIVEMGEQKTGRPGVKPLGQSHCAGLRRIAREPFGQKLAKDVTHWDVIELAKSIKARGLKPCSVDQYLIYLSGAFDYAGSSWRECASLTSVDSTRKTPFEAAKPFLAKNGIIGKSEPRSQRPTDAQLFDISMLAEKRNKNPRTKIDLVKLESWQWASSMRLSNSCEMRWGWWNREAQTLTVHGMKDPRRKGKVKTVALTPEAQALLIAWSFERKRPEDPEEPIFGYNAKSASQASASIKRKLGIPARTGIRLHDSRRDCASRLVEEKGYTSEEAIGFTGHETPAIFQKHYMKLNVELLKQGPASQREQFQGTDS